MLQILNLFVSNKCNVVHITRIAACNAFSPIFFPPAFPSYLFADEGDALVFASPSTPVCLPQRITLICRHRFVRMKDSASMRTCFLLLCLFVIGSVSSTHQRNAQLNKMYFTYILSHESAFGYFFLDAVRFPSDTILTVFGVFFVPLACSVLAQFDLNRAGKRLGGETFQENTAILCFFPFSANRDSHSFIIFRGFSLSSSGTGFTE